MHPHSTPGRIYIVSVRKVRQKHIGTLVWHAGEMCNVIGYAPDGLTAVYMPHKQLDQIRESVNDARKGFRYRMLQYLIRRFELNAV